MSGKGTWTVKHEPCGQLARRDEYGFLDQYHDSGACRPNGAHHPRIPLPRTPRSQLGHGGP
jgi:hypothetical protein